MKKQDENFVQQKCWLYVLKNHPELIMHSVVNGFGVTIPKTIPIIYHEKIRSIIAMRVNLLKMTGMTSGIADQIIHGKKGRCIWVEFKSATGTQRDEQVRMQQKTINNGGIYLMPRSLDQFIEEITSHLSWLYGN